MKKTLITITLLTSTLLCFSADIKKDSSEVKITYIANEGFLIEVNDKSLLIDALFGVQEYDFCDIPDDTQLEGMRKARDHFENIDLILATHAHRDHFHAPFVMDHLSKNKKGKFISCKQSIHEIKGRDDDHAAIKPQLVEVTPDSLSYKDTAVNGIEVRVFRLNHGPYYVEDAETGKKINQHRNVQNLGFLFLIDGIKIFHGGDSSPSWKSDFEHFRLDKENIDIALLSRSFLWDRDPERIELLKNYINPDHIVLMHIQPDRNERFIDMAQKMKDEFPSVKVFEEPMETKIYRIE